MKTAHSCRLKTEEIISDAVYNKRADPGETDDLRELINVLRDEFRYMLDHRPPTGSTDISVAFPDEINVYSS